MNQYQKGKTRKPIWISRSIASPNILNVSFESANLGKGNNILTYDEKMHPLHGAEKVGNSVKLDYFVLLEQALLRCPFSIKRVLKSDLHSLCWKPKL